MVPDSAVAENSSLPGTIPEQGTCLAQGCNTAEQDSKSGVGGKNQQGSHAPHVTQAATIGQAMLESKWHVPERGIVRKPVFGQCPFLNKPYMIYACMNLCWPTTWGFAVVG